MRRGRVAPDLSVLSFVRDHPGCSALDICARTGISLRTVEQHLTVARSSGWAECEGVTWRLTLAGAHLEGVTR